MPLRILLLSGPLLLTVSALARQQDVSDQLQKARAALAAAEAAHPGNSKEVAEALNVLVQRERVTRQLGPETDALALRALDVSIAVAGKDSILYATALAGQGKLDASEDHPELGRPKAEQALEIARRAAPGTQDMAMVADALDKICFELRDMPCAKRAAEEAVAAIRVAGPGNELFLASMLQDLAQIKMIAGDTAGARAGIDESSEIVNRQTETAPSMAVLESNAGAFFSRQHQPDEAILHLNRALSLSAKIYGADSIQVGYATRNLGDLYAIAGRNAESEEQFERSLALYRKWYGPTHTRTAETESTYARTLVTWGKLPEALDIALHAQRSFRDYLTLSLRVLPVRQALALAENTNAPFNVALTITAKHPEVGAAAVYQEEIRARGLVAEEMARRQASLNRSNDPAIADLLKQLDKERSTAMESSGSSANGSQVQQAYNDSTMRMERIERTLAERSLAFRADQRNRTVALDDVRAHLPRHAVLISYVSYLRCPTGAQQLEAKFVPSYMAFVVHPGTDRIRVYDLGDAQPINDLVTQMRAAADAEAHGGGLGARRNERQYRESGGALRSKIWDPLRADVGQARLALVVADGLLNLIPFAGLPQGKGYLVERGPVVHMLTSERDLVPSEDTTKKTGLLAIGSPLFDMAGNTAPPDPLRGATVSCDEFRSLEFHALPGAGTELSEIRKAWQRWNGGESEALVTGADATRARFLVEAQHSRVLHIATHAFLLDKSCGNGNPLLHSGLVFAGANQGHEDSILTAQQIASLDLSGVDWAVLSACNTGNGELHDGEGVLGLERAFRVAGAHSVIMTLWPVDDDVTRRFMHELYTERLARHASTSDAVWNASRHLLLERRAAGKSTHPWYWAGFVGSGGWQ